MAVEHPNKILAHEPQQPFPKVFKVVFGLLCLYLLIIFLGTGADFLVHHGGGH
ncbi:MAG: hypothetical protein KC800_07040 [Candidatus Eremiobacteraeota bacterium]|nr:hypothetical protein [Candidatus Eremiobacteraeota bacterium]